MSKSFESSRAAGRYMMFRLADETYGLQILKVRELVGLLDITRVPGTAPSLRGVVNLRGKVISVIDLRTMLGMGQTVATPQSVIIVLEHGRGSGERSLSPLGLLVDEVLEVSAFAESSIEPPPELGDAAPQAEFFLGVGKGENRLVLLLDIDRVLESAPHASRATGAQTPSAAHHE